MSSSLLILVVGKLKQVASELLRHPVLPGVLMKRDLEVGAEIGKVLLLALPVHEAVLDGLRRPVIRCLVEAVHLLKVLRNGDIVDPEGAIVFEFTLRKYEVHTFRNIDFQIAFE